MATIASDRKLTRTSLQTDGAVARISLRNPPLNIIDVRMMEEFAQAIAELEAQPAVSIILLTGEGRAFSAGVDIAAHTPDKVEEMLAKFHGVIRSLMSSKKVTIASVHGLCLGGGAELAMICDLVYTSEDAEWGFPEIKLGCYPPVACTALAALIGQKRAAEMILTGRSIGGREAAEIGLATRAVAGVQLSSTVDAAAGQLLHLSPAALALAKKASYAWDSMHFDKGLLRAEKIYFEELMKTSDGQEGIQAFLEKRSPNWRGR
jgi:cyclohexa-1,5-dienecarbonyl-CoA hydratase